MSWIRVPRVLMVGAFVVPLLFGPTRLSAQSAAREQDVKATLLFNFCLFIQWPAKAFESPGAPFVIGVLGQDPFGPVLDALVAGERSHGRSIDVKRFARLEEIKSVHLLFISGSEQERLETVLAALRGRPILTVGDTNTRDFAHRGGMIGFVTEKDSIRLRINLDEGRAAGLNFSAKLLRLAEIVRTRR